MKMRTTAITTTSGKFLRFLIVPLLISFAQHVTTERYFLRLNTDVDLEDVEVFYLPPDERLPTRMAPEVKTKSVERKAKKLCRCLLF